MASSEVCLATECLRRKLPYVRSNFTSSVQTCFPSHRTGSLKTSSPLPLTMLRTLPRNARSLTTFHTDKPVTFKNGKICRNVCGQKMDHLGRIRGHQEGRPFSVQFSTVVQCNPRIRSRPFQILLDENLLRHHHPKHFCHHPSVKIAQTRLLLPEGCSCYKVLDCPSTWIRGVPACTLMVLETELIGSTVGLPNFLRNHELSMTFTNAACNSLCDVSGCGADAASH